MSLTERHGESTGGGERRFLVGSDAAPYGLKARGSYRPREFSSPVLPYWPNQCRWLVTDDYLRDLRPMSGIHDVLSVVFDWLLYAA